MTNAHRRCIDSGRQDEVSFPLQEVSFPPFMVKRSRTYIELPTSGHRVSDTDLLNASYERYLRSLPISSYWGETGRSIGGFDDLPDIDNLDELRVFLALWGSNPVPAAPSLFMGVDRALGASDPAGAAPSRFMGVGGRPEILLHPNVNASSTLLVQGLPANCTRREVSHLFRPFVGYKDVRLVIREAKHFGGDPLVLCFVDFQCLANAVTAMDALQGYIFDDHDCDSGSIRLQVACSPIARKRKENLEDETPAANDRMRSLPIEVDNGEFSNAVISG